MVRRAGNVSNEQKIMLIEFVKKNAKLIEGKFTKDFTYKDGQKLWKDISKILNGVPKGALKNWKQWRKVWQDIKTKTKSKKAIINRHRCQTGGGAPYEHKLDDVESAIFDVVSKTSIEGVQNINETPYTDPMDMNDIKVPTTSCFLFDAELVESASAAAEDPLKISISHIPNHENLESIAVTTHNKVHMKTPIKQVLSKRQRLEKTMNATESMTRLYKQKLEIKENYYKRKLELMEEDIQTKKDILQNLKVLTDILSKK